MKRTNCVICVLHSVPWHSFVKLYSFLPSILSHFSILTSSFLLLCCIKNQLLLHLSTHANFLIGTATSNPLHLLFSCSTLVPTSSSHMHSCFFSHFIFYPSLLQPCIVSPATVLLTPSNFLHILI